MQIAICFVRLIFAFRLLAKNKAVGGFRTIQNYQIQKKYESKSIS